MNSVVPFLVSPPQVLHARAGYEQIPQRLSRAELFQYFTFPEQDRLQIAQCRGEHNKIGFALLLGGVRLTGRFPTDFELIPRHLLTHICEQLGLETPLFLSYPQRQPTRYEHTERLKTYLGLRTFKLRDREIVVRHVRQEVRTGARLHELLPGVEQALREQAIILPGVTVLKRLIGEARTKAEDELFAQLATRIEPEVKEKMLALLKVPFGEKITPFQQLQQAAGRPSPNAFTREVEWLEQVRKILPAAIDLSDFHAHLLERLADLVSGLPTQALLQCHETKRVALLLCWLWRLRTQLIDTALTISNELVVSVLRRARNAATKQQQQQHKRIGPVLQLCGEVVELLLDQAIPDAELRKTVDASGATGALH